MEKQLVMPKLQPEMKSGVLCAWLKDEGDEIHKGDALYEIETDKVVNQIEATEDGSAPSAVRGGRHHRRAGPGRDRRNEVKAETEWNGNLNGCASVITSRP